MEVLTIAEIKKMYPDEWVLLGIESDTLPKMPEKGSVILHGKDYLELCYKASEVAKNLLTTMFYTGTTKKTRKWLKSTRL
ncbi:MAG: hypothetical protein ACKVTZ_09085 [Bacteroidia bacterium]